MNFIQAREYEGASGRTEDGIAGSGAPGRGQTEGTGSQPSHAGLRAGLTYVVACHGLRVALWKKRCAKDRSDRGRDASSASLNNILGAMLSGTAAANGVPTVKLSV